MTPAVLDRLINGLVYYVYRNGKGEQYCTPHDFSRFGQKALYRIRVSPMTHHSDRASEQTPLSRGDEPCSSTEGT